MTTWQRKGRRLAAAAGFGSEDEAAAGPEAEAAALEGGEADGAAGAAGTLSRHIVLQGDDVDLPRLYEHFIFAMAHKGQYAGR